METVTRITGDAIGKKKPLKILGQENATCVLLFVFFMAVYTVTLCRTVFWWDSGELIANIAVLGIPHRPGFPIYVLLGKLLSLLPLWGFALRVNLLSSLYASLSMVVFYKVYRESVALFFPEAAKERRLVLLSGLSFVLVLGFTYSFWIQAVRAEVYSLNVLFFSLLLYLSIIYIRERNVKHLFLFFLLLGLGLGNHHLSLLSTVPAFCALFLTFARGSGVLWKRIPFCGLFFLLGLSVYLYLPIRSLSHPPLAWGQVESITSSAGSVLGLDTVGSLNLEFLSDMGTKIGQMVMLFSNQLTIWCFVVSLVGLVLLLRNSRKTLTFLLLLIGGNCAVVIFMATEFLPTNPDLHGYLVFSIFALAFLYGLGVLLVLGEVRRFSSFTLRLCMILFGVVSLLPLLKHHPQANLSRNRIAHDYGLSVISDLDSNSVLFADNVNLNFILRELQHGEGIREDVTVIDRGLLGFRWYAEQKRRELEPLFAGISGNSTGEPLFVSLLQRCLDWGKPTYIEFTERDSSRVNRLVPRGYVFKVSRDQIGQLSESDLIYQREWDEQNPFGLNLENDLFELDNETLRRDWDAQRVLALSFYRLGLFYQWKGMISHALNRYAQIRRIDPYNGDLLFRIRELEKVEMLSRPAHFDTPAEDDPAG